VSRRSRGSMPAAMPALDRRQFLRIVSAVAAVGATGGLAACAADLNTASSAAEQPSGLTIGVGLVAPTAGPFAKIGDDIQKGFNLYLAGSGGLLGRHTVDLKLVDEGITAETAAAAVKGLLSAGVVAVAGVANPAALPTLAGSMQEAKVPLVSTNAAPSTLTNALFVWRVSYVEGEAGRALAQYARSEGSRTYLLYEDSTSGRAEADAFRAAFVDLGGTIVGEAAGNANFGARLSTIRTSNVNSVFAMHSGADATALLDAYRTSNVTAKLLGTGSLTETIDLTKLAGLPERVYTSMYYACDLDNESNRRFVSQYHKQHGVQPSGYAMSAYDSASVLDKALRLVEGRPTASALNQAFSLLGQIDSPRGTWTFNINRSPQQKWYLRKLHLDGMVPANLLDTDLTVLG
jgi:branched-chain amino acid transport system substrate-binding protein